MYDIHIIIHMYIYIVYSTYNIEIETRLPWIQSPGRWQHRSPLSHPCPVQEFDWACNLQVGKSATLPYGWWCNLIFKAPNSRGKSSTDEGLSIAMFAKFGWRFSYHYFTSAGSCSWTPFSYSYIWMFPKIGASPNHPF